MPITWDGWKPASLLEEMQVDRSGKKTGGGSVKHNRKDGFMFVSVDT